jgi:hypothetical protein
VQDLGRVSGVDEHEHCNERNEGCSHEFSPPQCSSRESYTAASPVAVGPNEHGEDASSSSLVSTPSNRAWASLVCDPVNQFLKKRGILDPWPSQKRANKARIQSRANRRKSRRGMPCLIKYPKLLPNRMKGRHFLTRDESRRAHHRGDILKRDKGRE